jgi:CBS domain-containing protein
MNVGNILVQKGTDVATIRPDASIKRAAAWLRAKNIGALVVAEDDTVLGIVSERDIVRAFSQYGGPVASTPVKDVMTHGLITVAPEERPQSRDEVNDHASGAMASLQA